MDNQWIFYMSKPTQMRQRFKNEEIAALIPLLRLLLNHQSLIWTTHKDGIITKRTETLKGPTCKVKRSFEYLRSAVRKHVQKQTDKAIFPPGYWSRTSELLGHPSWRKSRCAAAEDTAKPEPTNEHSPSRVSLQHLVWTYHKATTKPRGWLD